MAAIPDNNRIKLELPTLAASCPVARRHMTMVDYLRAQASRCQLLSRTSNDLESATAFRVMAQEHSERAKFEEMREQHKERSR
jgi:hypothetical protein